LLPREKLVDNENRIKSLTPVNTAIGLTHIFLACILPILEGISGYYITIDLHLANALLTVVYAIWGWIMCVLMMGVLFVGRIILRMLTTSAKFHSEISKKSEVANNLLAARGTISFTVLNLANLCLFCAIMVISLASARYQIWAIPPLALAYCALLNLGPGVFASLFCIVIFIREALHWQEKTSKQTSERSTSSFPEKNSLSGRVSDKGNPDKHHESFLDPEPEREPSVKSEFEKQDELIDSFINSVSELRASQEKGENL